MKKVIFVIVGVLVWLLSIALDLQYSFGFVGFFDVILVALLGSMIMSVIGLVGFIRKKKSRVLGIGLILLIFCISEIIVSGRIAERQKQLSFAQAEKIISALDNFHSATGQYPAGINELVPTYLKEIPATRMGWFGTSFNYYKMKEGGYRLSFEYRVFLIASYDSKKRAWIVDD